MLSKPSIAYMTNATLTMLSDWVDHKGVFGPGRGWSMSSSAENILLKMMDADCKEPALNVCALRECRSLNHTEKADWDARVA